MVFFYEVVMQREGLFFPFVRHIDKVIVEIRNIFIANNAMFSQLFCNFA